MLDRCHQLHISLNLKKCIFSTSFGTLLEDVVCKEGLLVDQVKIVAMLDMAAPTSIIEFVVQKYKVSVDTIMSEGIVYIKIKVGNNVNFSISRLDKDIPCSCRRVTHCTRCLTHITWRRENSSPRLFFQPQVVQLCEELYHHGA